MHIIPSTDPFQDPRNSVLVRYHVFFFKMVYYHLFSGLHQPYANMIEFGTLLITLTQRGFEIQDEKLTQNCYSICLRHSVA